jgi:hypothetical protein
VIATEDHTLKSPPLGGTLPGGPPSPGLMLRTGGRWNVVPFEFVGKKAETPCSSCRDMSSGQDEQRLRRPRAVHRADSTDQFHPGTKEPSAAGSDKTSTEYSTEPSVQHWSPLSVANHHVSALERAPSRRPTQGGVNRKSSTRYRPARGRSARPSACRAGVGNVRGGSSARKGASIGRRRHRKPVTIGMAASCAGRSLLPIPRLAGPAIRLRLSRASLARLLARSRRRLHRRTPSKVRPVERHAVIAAATTCRSASRLEPRG